MCKKDENDLKQDQAQEQNDPSFSTALPGEPIHESPESGPTLPSEKTPTLSDFPEGEREGKPLLQKGGSPRNLEAPVPDTPPAQPSRTQHSARNATVGLLCQGITMLLAFVVRVVLVRTLGDDYVGISGWFSSILSILSITELGIGTAIVVSLYQPLTTGDQPRIRATVRLLRRAYYYVGLTILALGLALLPFLPSLLNKQTDLVNLRTVYLMFLGQSVCSYWFGGYKGSVFTADQRQSRIHIIGLMVSVLSAVMQIVALTVFHNYYLFVAAYPVAAIVKNLITMKSAERAYPYLRGITRPAPEEDDEAALPKEKRRSIFKNLFGLSLYRVSGTVLNATDSLVLGKYIGLGIIGIRDNYMMVITAVSTVLTLLFQSFTASIGHLHVTADAGRQHFIYRCLNLLDDWLYSFSAVCLFVLLDPFVALVFGGEWLFADARIVPVIVLNFLTSGLLENTIVHKDACGLFWQGRFRPVFSAGLNIVLSLWWVHPWGILGVLLATVVSRLLTTWWFDPWMVHHYAFQTGVKGYFMQTGLWLALAILCSVGMKLLAGVLFPSASWGGLFALLALCIVVPNGLFWLVFHRREEYAYLRGQALRLARKVLGKSAAA